MSSLHLSLEAKRILEAPISNMIDLINQFSLQDETPSESVPVELVRLEAAFRVDSTTTSTNNHSRSEDPFEHTPPRSPRADVPDSEEDTMPYPYPRSVVPRRAACQDRHGG